MLPEAVRAAGNKGRTVTGLLLLFIALSSCKVPQQTAALHQNGSSQSAHALHVKTVSAATGALVFELDQKRGALNDTRATIGAGTMLVTLPWGEWDIIRTDPLRMVHQSQLSSSRDSCPLSTYALNRFDSVPDTLLQGARLVQQEPSSVATPLIVGPHLTITESDLGIVAKSTHAMSARFNVKQNYWGDAAWMPLQAQTWFSDLQVPADEVTPLVDDNAFLDFASCYLKHQSDLTPTLIKSFRDVRFAALANGQHAVLKDLTRFDSTMYELDRDVLHFGVIAAARTITYGNPERDVVLSKRYFGLEVAALGRSGSSYGNAPPSDAMDVVENLVKRVASTDVGWKLAIYQWLFNDPEHFSLQNQIFTGLGQVVLIDHEAADPLFTAVPCFVVELLEGIDDDAAYEAVERLFADKRYAEFVAKIRELTTFRIVIDSDGTVFDATQFYSHLYIQNETLPLPLQQMLNWILENRAKTEPIVRHFFEQWAYYEKSDEPIAAEDTGVCVFFERIAWLSANKRLPSETEGVAIMNQCGVQPESTCELVFY
jgi:hypothetical protein